MLIVSMSIVGAIVIVVACIALLAIAGGLVMRRQGDAAERIDPLGDPIKPQGFERPRDEGDLL
jgi:hypothetical protein